jgi:DNA-binding transcriptional LysR family regulator
MLGVFRGVTLAVAAIDCLVEFSKFGMLVPEGKIEPTSECTGDLLPLIHHGHLEAALVSLPIHTEGLFVHKICSEDVLVCMRADDPSAILEEIPQSLVGQRLRIMFAKVHHPLFHEKLTRKLAKAGIHLNPSAYVSA